MTDFRFYLHPDIFQWIFPFNIKFKIFPQNYEIVFLIIRNKNPGFTSDAKTRWQDDSKTSLDARKKPFVSILQLK